MLGTNLAINLAEHDVEGADDRRDVRQHVPRGSQSAMRTVAAPVG